MPPEFLLPGEEQIKDYDRPSLRALHTSLGMGAPPAGVRTGKAAELLVLRLFELDGASVTWPYSVGAPGQQVEQIDGAIHCGAMGCLVETKDTADPVDFGPIAKLAARLMRRPPTGVGIIVSKAGFTVPAVLSARSLIPFRPVLLWWWSDIASALDASACDVLEVKQRFMLEYGMPDCVVSVL